jgi:hypothetical protein
MRQFAAEQPTPPPRSRAEVEQHLAELERYLDRAAAAEEATARRRDDDAYRRRLDRGLDKDWFLATPEQRDAMTRRESLAREIRALESARRGR